MVPNRNQCCYCRAYFSVELVRSKTADHFIPSSRGGFNIDDNRIDVCRACNQWKADKLPETWLHEVEVCLEKKKFRSPFTKNDLAQIIGSLRHLIKIKKGRKIAIYKKL